MWVRTGGELWVFLPFRGEEPGEGGSAVGFFSPR